MSETGQQSSIAIGVEDHDLLPYSECRNGQFVGVLPTILDTISKEKHLNLVLKPFAPWDLNNKLDDGKIALRFPDNPAWHSGEAVKMFSDPVVRFVDQYFALEGHEPNLDEPVKVGSIHGYTLPVSEQSQYVSTCTWYDSNLHLMDAMRSNIVDVVYGNAWTLPLIAERRGCKIMRFPFFPPREGFYHFSCRMEHSGILLEINEWIQRHRLELDNWSGDNFIAL